MESIKIQTENRIKIELIKYELNWLEMHGVKRNREK